MINPTGGGNQLINKLQQELQKAPQKEQEKQQVSAEDKNQFEDALNDNSSGNEQVAPSDLMKTGSKPLDPLATGGKPIDPLAAGDKAQQIRTAANDIKDGVDKMRSAFKDAVSALHSSLENQDLSPATVNALKQLREISGLTTAEGIASDVTSKLDQDLDTLLKNS